MQNNNFQSYLTVFIALNITNVQMSLCSQMFQLLVLFCQNVKSALACHHLKQMTQDPQVLASMQWNVNLLTFLHLQSIGYHHLKYYVQMSETLYIRPACSVTRGHLLQNHLHHLMCSFPDSKIPHFDFQLCYYMHLSENRFVSPDSIMLKTLY